MTLLTYSTGRRAPGAGFEPTSSKEQQMWRMDPLESAAFPGLATPAEQARETLFKNYVPDEFPRGFGRHSCNTITPSSFSRTYGSSPLSRYLRSLLARLAARDSSGMEP